MNIAFVILFIVVAQLLHQIAVDQSMGLNPYPFGTTIFCYITHLILLITCIRYLGWLFGILLFIGEFFSLIHASIGWILEIPFLFIKKAEIVIKLVKFRIAILPVALIATLTFCILSFFMSTYASLYKYLWDNVTIVFVSEVVLIIGSIIRIFVAKKVS